MWKEGSYLCCGDKESILAQVRLERDSPSQRDYEERERRLLEMTRELLVRPGQSNNLISFHDYYDKNWKKCEFRWVLAFRKNLPTKGCNDTQAVEATFSAIKRLSKTRFGNRTPSLSDLIRILPEILDKRNEERMSKVANKRHTIYHKNPIYREALETASWKINSAGMRIYHEAMEMCDSKVNISFM